VSRRVTLWGELFIGAIDPSFLIIGMLGLIMTIFGLLGNLVLLEKRLWFIELDALVIILMYIAGVALLVQMGLAV
jgi:cation:H+ antiporter